MNDKPKKIVFFHVPKCMGTTITAQFIEKYGADRVLTNATIHNYLRMDCALLQNYDVLGGHITYDCLSLINFNYELITVLRNPGRRLISLYSYYRKIFPNMTNPHESIVLANQYDFHDWLDMRSPMVFPKVDNSIIRQFVPGRFFTDKAFHGNILYSAKNFLNKFEFIGFNEYQSITNKFLQIKYRLNSNLDSCHLNSSDSENIKFSEYKLSEYIRNYCQLDCQFIAYAREIMHPMDLTSAELNAIDKALFEFF